MHVTIYLTKFQSPSHTLLAQAAARETGLPEAEFTALLKAPGGKLSFSAHPTLHFSLSHSGSLWACAFGGEALGLDIQKYVEKPFEKLSRRWFHPAEQDYLASCEYRDFTAIWCAKESFVKYTGEGIARGFARFATADQHGLLSGVENTVLTHFSPAPSYAGCLCTREPTELHLVWL